MNRCPAARPILAVFQLASQGRESGEQVAAGLDRRGMEAEVADIDVGQPQPGALATVVAAFAAYPYCGGVELGPRGVLMLRLRPSVGGEIVAGEAGVAQKARPDGDPGQSSRSGSTRRCLPVSRTVHRISGCPTTPGLARFRVVCAG
jgi:hypothetical protein